jgi:hypothetical protein
VGDAFSELLRSIDIHLRACVLQLPAELQPSRHYGKKLVPRLDEQPGVNVRGRRELIWVDKWNDEDIYGARGNLGTSTVQSAV